MSEPEWVRKGVGDRVGGRGARRASTQEGGPGQGVCVPMEGDLAWVSGLSRVRKVFV